jgi:glycine/D-amino acid oxidase-like deaminating enzyme
MTINRRLLMLGGAGALGGCTMQRGVPRIGTMDAAPALAPIRAHKDRLFDITVCLRPFRAAGPRLDSETIGDALVVHNYGHGGSGWSLSWGSSTIAVKTAMERSPREIAVIGCGALGLTSAILAQRAGLVVTIYCKDLVQQARSARATGSWTPDSRIALTSAAGPAFAGLWEEMARTSWKTYRDYLGLPGNPVEFKDRYALYDGTPPAAPSEPPGSLDFATYGGHIADLTPRSVLLSGRDVPFPVAFARRTSALQFNIHAYADKLLADFRAAGGRIVMREFHAPGEFAQLPQKVVINCTGYGARALWRDDSIVPVRGQIGWLIPQPEVNYGLYYRDVSMVSRSDGIVVQWVGGGDMFGYGDDHEVIDRAEAERGVDVLAGLYSGSA